MAADAGVAQPADQDAGVQPWHRRRFPLPPAGRREPASAGATTAGAVTALAATPDASLVAAVVGDQVVLVDDAGAELLRIGLRDERVEGLWLTPGAELLLILDRRGVTAVDPADGRPVALPGAVGSLAGATGGALTPDGRLLALTDRDRGVRALNLHRGTVTFAACAAAATAPVWRFGDPALWFVAAGSLLGWNPRLPGAEPAVRLPNVARDLTRFSWAPDGSRLAGVGPWYGTLWEFADEGLRHIGDLPGGLDVLFVDQDRLLVSSGTGLRPYRYRNGRVDLDDDWEPLGDAAGVATLTAPGTLVVAGADGVVEVRRPPGSQDPAGGGAADVGAGVGAGADTEIGTGAGTGTGTGADAGGTGSAAVRRWATAMARTVGRGGDPRPGRAPRPAPPRAELGIAAPRATVWVATAGSRHPPVAWSPDGELFYACPQPWTVAAYPAGGGAPFWECAVPAGDGNGFAELAVDAAGHRVAAVSAYGEGVVLETVRDPVEVVARFPAGRRGAAWHPLDDRLAVGGTSDGVRLLPPPWLGDPQVLDRAGDGARFAFAPDGSTLAVAGPAGYLWQETEGSWHRSLRLASRSELTRVAFSPDGRSLAATGERAAVVWRVGEAEPYRVFGRPGGYPLAPALAWSPDGTRLAFPAAGRDSGVVEVWDVEDARRIGVLDPGERAAGHLWGIAWNRRSGRLIATHSPGYATVWDLSEMCELPRTFGSPEQPGAAEPAGTAWAVDGGPAGRLPEAARAAMVRLATAAAEARLPVRLDELVAVHSDVVERHGDGADRGRDKPARRETALGWPADALAGPAVMAAYAGLARHRFLTAPADAPAMALGRALERALMEPGAGLDAAEAVVSWDVPAGSSAPRLSADQLAVLRLLGADAVRMDPLLPFRLTDLRLDLIPPAEYDSPLRKVRGPAGRSGRAVGPGGIDGLAGIARHGALHHLLLSQLALDDDLLDARIVGGDLLYRQQATAVPSRGRSVVVILDDTAAATGPVGVTIRLVAHLAAVSLLRTGHALDLVRLAEPARARTVAGAAGFAAIWAPCSPAPARPARALLRADEAAYRRNLSSAPEPRIVVLTHAFRRFADATPTGRRVDAVRVRFPGGQAATRSEPSLLPARPTAAELRRTLAFVIGP